MIARKPFLYFLLDTPTGKAYYRSATGTILTAVITAGIDVSCKNAPANWLETDLGFIRNETKHGISRSYGTPQEFVRGEYEMIRELFLLGVGTEVPLTLAVFKYNTQPNPGDPEYGLYYKATLDLSEIESTVLESISAPLIQGGPAQLIKAYENTVIEIPCDGSIPENLKANLDGLKVEDTYYYNFVPFTNNGGARSIMPVTFANNEGDNFGVVHNNSMYENILSYPDPARFLIDSSSWFFYSTSAIKIRMQGFIVAGSDDNTNVGFTMAIQSNSLPVATHLVDLILAPNEVNSDTRFDFDVTLDLAANEKIFITFFGGSADHHLQVVSGGFSVKFASQYKPTRPWGITFSDLFKLVWKKINELSNTVSGSSLIYPATSELLDANLNLIITSGDALRASGDSSYQRFYSLDQNSQLSFGPVIKTTLKQCYEAAEAILFAAFGTKGNTVYIEKFAGTGLAVYKSDSVDFSLGELSFLKWRNSQKFKVSDFIIGYEPQTYDQKAGKYEYNTKLQMKAPVTSFEKGVQKISSYRTDSYGIERLRSNIGAATSTTRNDSDSGVFVINTDIATWVYDFFKAYFISLNQNPDDAANTNIVYTAGGGTVVSHQKLNLLLTDGEYFQPNTDTGIFVFSQTGYAATESCNLTISGLVNSVNKPPTTPDDTVIITLWLNGVAIFQDTTTVIGVNTPIAINHNFSQALAYNDCIFITAETSATGEAQLNTVDLTIGTYASMSGTNIPILSGTYRKLLSLPTVINSVTFGVMYGYQYFMFNSLVLNNIFDFNATIKGCIEGGTGTFKIQVYINGVLQAENILINATLSRTFFTQSLSAIINRAYSLGDIVFVTVTNHVGSGGEVQYGSIFEADVTFTSDYIKAYNLKRVQYDSLIGIPNIATNAAGDIRSDVSGAPYNIEDLTPKTIYNKWKPWLNSCFVDQVKGPFTFQTLSKNKYLSRTVGSLTVAEASNETVLGNDRFAYPIEIEAGVNVPLTFREAMKGLINTHVHATYMGNDVFFYIENFKQKPALNESQTWTATLSDKTDLSVFANITGFKLPDMSPNSIFCPFLSTVQFVPVGQTQPAKYKTFSRNNFLFREQVARWSQREGYCQPVQIGDIVTLQFITRDLDPVIYTVYNCSDDSIYAGPTNLDTIAANSIVTPFILWQKYIDTSAWAAGDYYIVISNTTAGDLLCSECLDVRVDWPDTVLAEFTNSQNTQQFVFLSEAPFTGSMRFRGMFDNRFKQKYAGRFYIDQPQDISMLNAIPYETTTLFIGGEDGGCPDYVHRKILRMLLLDGLTLDGEAYSLNDGAEMQDQFITDEVPKTFKKIDIRPKNNLFGISVTAGEVDTDASLLVTVDAGAFGPNDDNESGTTAPDIININVTQ